MSPNQISVLLSIKVCGDVSRALCPTTAPVMPEYLNYFLNQEVIAFEGTTGVDLVLCGYKLTKRGAAYVAYLEQLPLPRERTEWVIDNFPFSLESHDGN